jgi:hypothetical protein
LPSPLAHSAIGYLIYRQARTPGDKRRIGPLPWLLLITVVVSNLPDLDFIAGILFGDLWAYHNQITHSLVVGTGVSLLAAGLTWLLMRHSFGRWYAIFSLSYYLHIIMDFFTYKTRGIMLFWPLSEARFESPVKLFYGVRWSEGLFSASHLITLVTELVFAAALLLVVHLISKRGGSSGARSGDTMSFLKEGGC